jgi:chromosome partitioning protein
MLLAIVAAKGGVGKTTTAVHLAEALTEATTGRVVLLDGDATRAATAWLHRGAGRLCFDVRAPGDPTGDAAHVVVDTAANEAPADLLELTARADVVLIPTPPYALDLAATLHTLALLTDHPHVRVLLTRTPPAPQRDALDARALLEGRGAQVLRHEVPHRKVFTEAALAGVTIRSVRGGTNLWPIWPAIVAEVTP